MIDCRSPSFEFQSVEGTQNASVLIGSLTGGRYATGSWTRRLPSCEMRMCSCTGILSSCVLMSRRVRRWTLSLHTAMLVIFLVDKGNCPKQRVAHHGVVHDIRFPIAIKVTIFGTVNTMHHIQHLDPRLPLLYPGITLRRYTRFLLTLVIKQLNSMDATGSGSWREGAGVAVGAL